jgi:hypothetical protein
MEWFYKIEKYLTTAQQRNNKAYRTISLFNCMGKVVEKVVAELLSEEAERRGLLSDGQFGNRKGRSAIDAAAIMVNRAHAAWTNGDITGVLLMDIKAAFPSVANGRLVNGTVFPTGRPAGWAR